MGKPGTDIAKRILETAFREDLFRKGSKILAAVSGGPDSICLLDLLSRLKDKYDLELAVAHVNYGLRGSESDRDERIASRMAAENGLEFFVLRPKNLPKGNLESRLRDIRYDFFEKIRKSKGFDSIAIAHNRDDQVETLLLRLVRGSGLKGLSAMRFRNGFIIRPLLGTSQKDILAYLKERKLAYGIDRTNREDVFLRNRIRNRLLPYLEKNYNPNIRKTLFEASRSIADDYALLTEFQKEIAIDNPFSAKEFLALPDSSQKYFLRALAGSEKGDLFGIGTAQIGEMVKAIRSRKNKRQTVSFQGLIMTRNGDKITLEISPD